MNQWFWRRRWKCEKLMDRWKTAIRKAHFKFHLRWTNKENGIFPLFTVFWYLTFKVMWYRYNNEINQFIIKWWYLYLPPCYKEMLYWHTGYEVCDSIVRDGEIVRGDWGCWAGPIPGPRRSKTARETNTVSFTKGDNQL